MKLLDLILNILDELKNGGSKPWYLSKTIWTNVIAVAALLIQLKYGFIVSPEEQIAVLTVANLILRAFTGKVLRAK